MNKRPRTHCYLCGTGGKMTREHVPPKGFFPDPKPSNLITVPCCWKCNNPKSENDEMLRLFAASAVNRNEAGSLVWRNAVVPRTLKRDRLREQRRAAVATARLVSRSGGRSGKGLVMIQVPQAHVNPWLVKVVKGLMWTFRPETDYRGLLFDVKMIPQFKVNAIVGSLPPTFVRDERGSGVFEFWRTFAADAPSCGIWVLLFFGAVGFVVSHTTPDRPFSTPFQVETADGHPDA